MLNRDRRPVLAAAGALALLLATLMGAYGTHALQGTLDATRWNVYRVAVDYQFYHGLGVIAAALLADRFPGSRWIGGAGWTLLLGMTLFCGSLYATTLGGPPWIGGLAPVGGLAMMGGWLALGVGALRAR